jgi:hypothetical protein
VDRAKVGDQEAGDQPAEGDGESGDKRRRSSGDTFPGGIDAKGESFLSTCFQRSYR